MTPDDIRELLASKGALVAGHFAEPDGTHSDLLIRPLKATQFAPVNRRLCYEIVRHFLELDIHVVIAASVAAIPVAVEIGRQLEARVVFMDERAGAPALHEGFELHEGERGIVVESLMESDERIDAVAAIMRAANARMIGVGSIVDTRAARKRLNVKDVAVLQAEAAGRYAAAACPLCAAGLPLGVAGQAEL